MESEKANVLTDQEAEFLFHVFNNIEGGILQVSSTVSPYLKGRTRWASVISIFSFSVHYQHSLDSLKCFPSIRIQASKLLV